VNFDTSSLTPLGSQGSAQSSPAASGLDLSSLRPMGQPDTSEPSSEEDTLSSPATIGNVAKQAALGLVTGLPKLPGELADTVTALNPLNPSGLPAQAGKYLQRKAEEYSGLKAPDVPDVSAPDITTPAKVAGNVLNAGAAKIDSALPKPQNAPERIGRAAGEGAITMAVPGLGEEGIAAKALSGLRNAFVGAPSGVGSQGAAEAVPEPYKPYAAIAGGLVGGLAGEGFASIPSLAKAGVRAGADYVAPFTEGGQQRLAGTALRDAATNPDDVISAIDNQPRSLVPGSNPTTFQLTGDMGLGRLERSVATQNPDTFQTLRGEQNAARLDALSDIQADGHPEAVSNFFRSQLDDLDKSTQALHDAAEQNARNQFLGIGGSRSPEAIGEDIKGIVNPQIEGAVNNARTAAEGLGGGNPAELGENARTAIQSRLDDVRTQERALWKAVDPEGNMQTVSSPIKQAVSRIYGDMGPESKLGMAPIENQIANVVSDYGQILPFQRLIDLRSAVSQAMRDVRSPLSPNQPAYGRLTQLRGAIEDAISDSVAQKAAQEQQAVATGAMKPEETFFQRFAREAGEFGDARRAARSRSAEAYFDLGEPDGGRPGVSDGEMGEGSAPSGTTGRATGSEGPEGPFLDQDTVDRLKAATAATAERKQTFGAKPVSQILQRPGNTQPYTMAPGNVASSIWKPGAAGSDSVRSVLRAAGNSPEAVESIRNMAAGSLRNKAENGIVTQRVLNQWRAQHGPALQALEDASPGTIQRFENAARASEGLTRFENFNPNAPSGVLPERYFATGDKGFGAVEELRSLIGKDRADKLMGEYAAESLKKSASRPDGTLDPKKFETWQKAHSGALRALPDLQARFMTAAKASDNLAAIAAQRKDVLDAYQKSAAGKLLKVDDPADVVKSVGSIFGRNDSVQQMRALVKEAAKNPDAMTGLRKSIVEYMESKLISNTEAGTSGRNLIKSDAFQTFLGKNFTALRQVFSDEELNTMRAVAQDLKRANRSISSSKLPGQSNTAQDLAGMADHDMKASLLSKVFTHAVGGGAGFLSGGPLGSLVGVVGSHVLSGMREAGIRNVQDLIKEGMLNPDMAKALLMKAPKRADTGSELTLATKLRNLGMFSTAQSQKQPNK